MNRVVVSYTNPDLDGVTCAIAIQALEENAWEARVIGNLDAETNLVLRELGITQPPPIEDWNSLEKVWLVDTHHLKQLPWNFPVNKVAKITDHHPSGDVGQFSKAEIQNEAVGAAATLVAEMFAARNVLVPSKIAILLQAAIVSNTLGFRASASSARDEAAFRTLKNTEPISGALLAEMEETRRIGLTRSTADILETDYKIFTTDFGQVVIAQVESPGSLSLLDREDIRRVLKDLAEQKDCVASVINLVDVDASESCILSSDSEISEILSRRLNTPIKNGVIRYPGITQRKTHIVPYLTSGN